MDFKHIDTFVEFPKFNVKARFVCKATLYDGYYGASTPHINIGCHVGILSNLYMEMDITNVQKINQGEPIKLDDSFNSYNLGPITSLISKAVLPEEEVSRIFKRVADEIVECKGVQAGHEDSRPVGYTYIFMSDNMNSYSSVFPKNSGIEKPSCLPRIKTSDFVNWLVANKVGVVTAAPISRNQYHQTGRTNFSATQAFIWLTPNFAPWSCAKTAFVSNAKSMANPEKWKKQVAHDAKIRIEDFDSKVWRDGKSLINRTTPR